MTYDNLRNAASEQTPDTLPVVLSDGSSQLDHGLAPNKLDGDLAANTPGHSSKKAQAPGEPGQGDDARNGGAHWKVSPRLNGLILCC